MRYGTTTRAPNLNRRAELLDEARACGRMGSARPSDACLFGDGDPSQTHILRVMTEFAVGQAERRENSCTPRAQVLPSQRT